MNGLLLSCQIENISTRKDKTVKIILGTQELSPSKAGELFTLLNSLAAVYISPKSVDQKEIDQVDKIDPEFGGKTQSQRLRNTLFVLWQQQSEGYKDFETFYHAKTEQIIEHFKTKLQ